MSGRGTDFFVSHAGRDTGWAEWLAWQLEQAGHTVELDVWDWAPGEDFVAHMQTGLERAARLLAVCTEAYFASGFGAAELRAAFARSAAAQGRIVPVLVEPVTLPPLYASLIHLDLTGLDEAAAAARLRTRLAGGRPTNAPPFPHPSPAPTEKPGFAGALLAVWKVPPRNPRFVGRDGMLTELRRRLRADENTLVVQALYGLGGVGKTQLAIEYAHRFAADYDLVWWIDAEQPVLIPEQLAGLADGLGLPAGATVTVTVERLLAELRGRDRWLLIYDNAERPGRHRRLPPGGAGHVLITSRNPGWGALDGQLEVDVLAGGVTVALLQGRIPGLSEELADKLAAELGDLPLAAAQAAGYLEQTDLPPAGYLRRFRTRRTALLARGDVVGYHGRLDTTWALSLERLRRADPAGVQLLELAAFLAPEPIPLALVGNGADLLDEPLRATAADPDALTDTVGALVGYTLARRSPDGFLLHRLVQAVIRHQLPADREHTIRQQVVALLAAAYPGDPEDPASWTTYARLAPHVLATAPIGDHSSTGRHLVLDTARFLYAKGDSRGSRAVLEPLLHRWRSTLAPTIPTPSPPRAPSPLSWPSWRGGTGPRPEPGHPAPLPAGDGPGSPDHPVGGGRRDPRPARVRRCRIGPRLGQETLERCRRVLGFDHLITLWASAALPHASVHLGEAEPARALGEDTLQRCRRALGLHNPTGGSSRPSTDRLRRRPAPDDTTEETP